jgi:hypothetical protein
MKQFLITILQIVAAAVAAEFALVLLTTLAQGVLCEGTCSWTGTSAVRLVFGGAGTVAAAVGAGAVGALVVRGRNYWPHAIVTVLIVLEMYWLVAVRGTNDPLWFEVLAGLSLIGGVWAGGCLVRSKMRPAGIGWGFRGEHSIET